MKLGSFLIISLMLSSNALIMSSFTEGEPSPPLVRGPLDAIKIDSDAELIDMASDLNWTGSGTEGDPIVISNLTIDTSGGYYGMLIANTTLHIVIENCSFYNSTDGFPHPFPSSGLILFNVISVVVTNSTFSYNTNGMTIGGCMNVEVRNSSFLRNLRGIEMILSNNSRILGCTMEENTRDGIFIETSEMCIVQGNMVLRNDPGIMLYRSEYNRISGNTMLYTSDEGVLLEYSNYNIVNDNFIDGFGDGDGITLSKASRDNIILNNTLKDPQEYGILLIKAANNKFYSNDLINCSFAIDDLYSIRESSSYYTSEVPANNTVNGKPLIYLMDLDLIGSTISPDCGQLFLVNVSNGLVEDVHLNNATFGIWLFQSSNIEIRNCSVMNMIYHGLQIFDSNNIRIRKVSFRECYYALFVMGSDRVTCSNSSFYYCDTGTFFRESVNCDLIGNEIHNMANYGVECVSSKFSIIDNIITLCERGIEMYDSILDECENAVRGNTISNCTEGIRGIAWFASVSNNNIMGCDLGIRMGAIRSVNSSIHHNHIESSHGDGVLLDGFSIRVHNNSIYAENGYGIHLAGPGYNVIENNRMYNCSITFSDFRRDVSRNTIGPGNMVNDLPVLMLLDPYGIYEDFNEPILAGQVLIQANYVELSNVHVSNATVGFYIDANTAFIDSCSVSRCDVGMEVGDDPTIENCRIFENDIGMKVVEWSPGASITDCEFVNNSIAVFNDGGERLALYSNLFLVNDKGVATYNGGDCTIKWNRFHNGPGPALSLTSGRDIVRDNMFIDNNDQIEGLDQISATEGTIVSDNYWSDHNGTCDFLTGVIDTPHKYDTSPIAYIPKGITPPPEILEVFKAEDDVVVSFDHPDAVEHMIYRAPAGGEYLELSVVTGDVNQYIDDTALDLANYSYMVQSITDLGLTFPSDPVSYLVDRTSPELEILSPLNGSWSNEDVIHVSWNYSDTGIGGCEVYLLIDGDHPPLLSRNLSYNITGLEEGHHKVKLTVVDMYGNSVEKEVHFSIDRTEPFVESILPDGGQLFNGRDISVQDRVWDENGLSSIERYLDGELIDQYPTDGILRDVAEGDHELVITAFDLAGNGATASVNFTVDLTPPRVISVLPHEPMIDVDTKFIIISFSEKMDPRMVSFSLNGREVAFQDGLCNTFQVSTYLLEEGSEVNLSISGTDPAGNRLEDVWFLFTMGERLNKVEIRVRDSLDGTLIKSVLNVSIGGVGGSVVTVENGTILLYLPLGHHTFIISGEGYQEFRYEFDLNGDLEYELEIDRVEEVDPVENEEEFPYLLIVMLAVTIILILFFYIVPAKLAARYPSDEE